MLTASPSKRVRASAGAVKAQLRPVVESVHAELTARGHQLVFSQTQELVAAGYGFYSHKLFLESVPLLRTRDSTTEDGAGHSQYRPMAIEKRSIELLPGISEQEAVWIGMLVVHHLRASNLVIDAHDAYFKPGAKFSKRILSALASGHSEFPPVNASVAMHAGLLPNLDPGLFRSLRDKGHGGRFSFRYGEQIAEAALGNRLYLYEGTVPEHMRRRIPYEDVYRGKELRYQRPKEYETYAAFGGRILLVTEEHLSPRNRVGNVESVSTRIFSSVAHYSGTNGWGRTWQAASYTTSLSETKRWPNQPERLDLASAPLVSYCEKCDQLYVENGPESFAHTGCRH